MTPEDFAKGCRLIGLTAEIVTTGSPEWKRVLIHQQGGEYAARCKADSKFVGLYVGRASFRHDEFYSLKTFYNGSYECYAIRLMLDKGKILNHINFYALAQQAHNAALLQLDIDDGKQSKKFLATVLKLFHISFRNHYYNGDTVVRA